MGDWGDFYYGRSCPKWSVTEDATIPCIRYGELYTKFGAKIDRVYSYTNMPPENLRFSKGTEVLIPRVGEDPMDYNHCTWLSMKDVAIGEMISVFNTDNNPLFTATMFNAIFDDPTDIVYLYRLAEEVPLLYAKLALRENGLQDYVDAMNWFS